MLTQIDFGDLTVFEIPPECDERVQFQVTAGGAAGSAIGGAAAGSVFGIALGFFIGWLVYVRKPGMKKSTVHHQLDEPAGQPDRIEMTDVPLDDNIEQKEEKPTEEKVDTTISDEQ